MSFSDSRTVRLFRNGRNQAMRIPVEFELPGSEAVIHREGNRLVVEPVQRKSLSSILDSLETLNEEFPDIADIPPRAEDIF